MTDCEKCCEHTVDCKCMTVECICKKDKKMQWIKLSDQKPEKEGPYKVYINTYTNPKLGKRQDTDDWYSDTFIHYENDVTHWAEIDEPPIDDDIDEDFKELSESFKFWIANYRVGTDGIIGDIYRFLEKKFKEKV